MNRIRQWWINRRNRRLRMRLTRKYNCVTVDEIRELYNFIINGNPVTIQPLSPERFRELHPEYLKTIKNEGE